MHIPDELLQRFGLERDAPTVEPAPPPPKMVGCDLCYEWTGRAGICWACEGDGGDEHKCEICDGTGACPDCGVRRED